MIDHSAVDPPGIAPTISASPSDGAVNLTWQPVAAATGYEIFETPSATTPFAVTPVLTVGADTTTAAVPNEDTTYPVFYAVSSIINGVPTMEHPLVSSLPHCSLAHLNQVESCLREIAGWYHDLTQPAARPPDFVVTDISANLPGTKVGADVGVAVSCDGNTFGYGGGQIGVGPVPASATLGYGWIKDRTDPNPPDKALVDQDLQGQSLSFSAGAGLGATFESGGGFIEWAGLDVGASVSLTYSGQVGTTYTPSGTCGSGGATSTGTFQALINTPIEKAAANVPILTTAAAGAIPVVGPLVQVYLLTKGFRAGSDVHVQTHSTPYDLGTFVADDQGNVGENVTLPGLSPGPHSVTLTGEAPDGSPMVQTIQIVVSNGPPIMQTGTTSDSTTPSTAYSGQLSTTGGSGTVTYAQTSGTPQITVSSSGAISAPATLNPGVYSASGTDSDAAGDAGVWSFTLAVSASPLDEPSGLGNNQYGHPLQWSALDDRRCRVLHLRTDLRKPGPNGHQPRRRLIEFTLVGWHIHR